MGRPLNQAGVPLNLAGMTLNGPAPGDDGAVIVRPFTSITTNAVDDITPRPFTTITHQP